MRWVSHLRTDRRIRSRHSRLGHLEKHNIIAHEAVPEVDGIDMLPRSWESEVEAPAYPVEERVGKYKSTATIAWPRAVIGKSRDSLWERKGRQLVNQKVNTINDDRGRNRLLDENVWIASSDKKRG